MPLNRLAREKSPYLLQHAHNPVDWYPWGPEAFAKAVAEDKPIFLSAGYSTCHWCHVMERESFEDEETAALLNRHFVPVKVDREERPDVDRIYMLFVQATTGGGGWPMSVFLTPDLKPFFGGTYFPPDNRYGRPGFRAVLEALARAWSEDRARILEASAGIASQLAGHAAAGPPERTGAVTSLDAAFQIFRRSFDARRGGFGGAPKFPRPVVHNFLLRHHDRTGDGEALEMVLTTLREMARGGIHDHIGGGFHRYSVDERWFVPHFEKMLYDQAQLAVSCLEAWQITHDEFFSGVARSILDYVLRDLSHPEGGFYSAEDADSIIDPAEPRVKGEGAFYTWTSDEIEGLLDPAAFSLFRRHYGIEPGGNVHDDPHHEFRGRNILYEAIPAASEQDRQSLAAARSVLLEARARRPRPHLDDKVLTAWNALTISAFAKAAQALDEPRYATAARRATDFLLRHLYDAASGVLLRRFRDGDAAIPGFLDDYAFLLIALLDLYETQFDTDHLELAVRLAGRMTGLFEDVANGGFYSTAEGDGSLILRLKDDYDGAEPAGNSMAALGLLRLAHLTGRDDFRRSADRTLAAFSARAAEMASAMPQMLVARMAALDPPRQIVITGPGDEAARMLAVVRRRFLPHTAVVAASEEARPALARLNPVFAAMKPIGGRATAYVCENYSCHSPVTDVESLAALLQ